MATEKNVNCDFTLTNNTQAKAVADFMIANKDVSVFRDCSKVQVFGLSIFCFFRCIALALRVK